MTTTSPARTSTRCIQPRRPSVSRSLPRWCRRPVGARNFGPARRLAVADHRVVPGAKSRYEIECLDAFVGNCSVAIRRTIGDSMPVDAELRGIGIDPRILSSSQTRSPLARRPASRKRSLSFWSRSHSAEPVGLVGAAADDRGGAEASSRIGVGRAHGLQDNTDAHTHDGVMRIRWTVLVLEPSSEPESARSLYGWRESQQLPRVPRPAALANHAVSRSQNGSLNGTSSSTTLPELGTRDIPQRGRGVPIGRPRYGLDRLDVRRPSNDPSPCRRGLIRGSRSLRGPARLRKERVRARAGRTRSKSQSPPASSADTRGSAR